MSEPATSGSGRSQMISIGRPAEKELDLSIFSSWLSFHIVKKPGKNKDKVLLELHFPGQIGRSIIFGQLFLIQGTMNTFRRLISRNTRYRSYRIQ